MKVLFMFLNVFLISLFLGSIIYVLIKFGIMMMLTILFIDAIFMLLGYLFAKFIIFSLFIEK